MPMSVSAAAGISMNQYSTGSGFFRLVSAATVPSYCGESSGSRKAGNRDMRPAVSVAVMYQRTICPAWNVPKGIQAV